MKSILAAMALSVSFMVGCQCTEKASDVEQPVPAEQPAQTMEPAPTEAAPTEGTEMPAEGGTEGGTETPPAAQ